MQQIAMKHPLLMAMIVAATGLSPAQASADRLHYATPYTPLAFTYPAVREWYPLARVKHVRHARAAKRVHAGRHARFAKRIAAAHWSCRPERSPYAYPPTGYTPLPYEFGPWCAAIVARY